MGKTIFVAIVLLYAARGAFAGDFAVPVTLTGITQLGYPAELRFERGAAKTGRLVILGGTSGGAPVEERFTYDVTGDHRQTARGAVVDVHFEDKQSVNITCDPLSDNCRSSGYVTESGATFSIVWTITRK